MTGSKFSLESVDLLHYHLQKTSLKRKQRSYIDSPKWFKNKKETINPKNDDDNCFEYASTAALSYQNIKRNTDVTNQQIDFASHPPKDWEKCESNNKTISLNILFVPYNTEEIRLAYKSKYNFKRENQMILLINSDGKK